MRRERSWSNISNTVFKVRSYVGLANDKEILRKNLQDADEKLEIFVKTYNGEVEKVKMFYEDKLAELSEHIEAIIESVDTSALKLATPKKSRKSSLIDRLVVQFEKTHLKKASEFDIPAIRTSAVFGDSSDDLMAVMTSDDSDSPLKRTRSKNPELLDLERESDSIKRALTDVYREAKMLHNYAIMNYTGFIKISKKFDKSLPAHKGMFKNNTCDDGVKAEVLAAKLEKMYAKWFCEGAIREAQAQLLSKRGDGLMMDWSQLRLGYRLGMCSILGLWVAWDCIWGQFAKDEISIGGRSAFPSMFGADTGDWMLSEKSHHHKDGFQTHVWANSFNQSLRRYLDTGKRVPNLPNAFKYAMAQTVTLFGTFHPLYLMSARGAGSLNISEDGDELIIKHRADIFQVFWIFLFVASSIYSFCWDVYMDWGLGRKEFGFLGPRLMFPRKSYYYMVIAADLVLRFMWVITLVPPQSGAKFQLPAYLNAVTMTIELFRRTIWGFFRLENEQRQNTLGFRRVHVVPLHFSTGHKHKYHERHWVGWKVLVEITIVTLIVIAISAFSVISAQRATTNYELELSHNSHSDLL
eukprot:scaffold6818_cov93-Cyclotella_meneghiniana.AAC.4